MSVTDLAMNDALNYLRLYESGELERAGCRSAGRARGAADCPTYLGVNSAGGVAERAAGYRGVKIHLSGLDPEVSFDRIVELVREAIGPEVQLMVDGFMRWDVAFALRVAEQVADCDLAWLEEPLPSDDMPI